MLYTVLKIRALDLEIAPELIATRDELQGLVKIGRDIPDANHQENDNMTGDEGQNALTFGWRRRLAGNELISVLRGTPIKVTVSDSSTNPIAINLCDGT